MSEPQSPVYQQIDPDTGLTTLEQIDKDFREKVESEAQLAQKILTMVQTEGWKFLSDWIYDQINSCKEKLVDEQEMQTIIRWQQTARAYSNLLGFVEQQVSLSKFLSGPTSDQDNL